MDRYEKLTEDVDNDFAFVQPGARAPSLLSPLTTPVSLPWFTAVACLFQGRVLLSGVTGPAPGDLLVSAPGEVGPPWRRPSQARAVSTQTQQRAAAPPTVN